MNKKASMSLSINAIVILVLAITMLGLGLGFTKSMFAKFGAKLVVPDPELVPTADNPIEIPSAEIELRSNKDTVMTIFYYNDYSTDTISPQIICKGGGGSNDLTFTGLGQVVESAKHKSFKFLINKDEISTIPSGTSMVCTIEFWHGENPGPDSIVVSKQIIFKVR